MLLKYTTFRAMFYERLLGAGVFSINLSSIFALSLNPALERGGLKGSLAKFGCRVGFIRFTDMPCSEGRVLIP
jgi:hypothetical protein